MVSVSATSMDGWKPTATFGGRSATKDMNRRDSHSFPHSLKLSLGLDLNHRLDERVACRISSKQVIVKCRRVAQHNRQRITWPFDLARDRQRGLLFFRDRIVSASHFSSGDAMRLYIRLRVIQPH